MAKIADQYTLEKVKEILDNETGEHSKFRLVQAMISGSLDRAAKFEDILSQLNRLKEGISAARTT
jgi:hypothetical protein